jgi:hypothetical protein
LPDAVRSGSMDADIGEQKNKILTASAPRALRPCVLG